MATAAAASSAGRPPTSSSASISARPTESTASEHASVTATTGTASPASVSARCSTRRRNCSRSTCSISTATFTARRSRSTCSTTCGPRRNSTVSTRSRPRSPPTRPRRGASLPPGRASPKARRQCPNSPKTDFPMKAGLPQKEPVILARWQESDLYNQVRESRAGREKFILHDGPPYANGDMHIGHALNHILKDMVVRTQTLLGKDAPYVPGWDCHGLPIEWKVEEQYRKKKLNKDEVPVKEFRAECRAYAQHWVDVQREQLKRLGIGGRWDKPYLTMNFHAEGTIVAELMKFAESGQLYRGAKPVMWSPVEKTALAEAEIEYEDITSTQIDVAFEIVESPIPELVGAHAVVWTTTPWTIPVNQAIAYGSEVDYRLLEMFVEGSMPEDTMAFMEGVSWTA